MDGSTKRCVAEVRTALMDKTLAKSTKFKTLAEVVFSEPDSVELIQLAANNVKKNTWVIENVQQITAASLMLPYSQPEGIIIDLPVIVSEISAMIKLLKEVQIHFDGVLTLEFKYWYNSYIPCDDLVMQLDGARCNLSEFRGCLSTAAALMVLTEMPRSYCVMWISVPDPMEHQLGSMVFGDYLTLIFKVKHGCCTAVPRHRPLPMLSEHLPSLIVDVIPSSGVTDAAALILAVAPEDNEVCLLRLRRCMLDDDALQQLVRALHAGGLRTAYGDECNWEQSCGHDDDLCGDDDTPCQVPELPDQRCIYLQLVDSPPDPPAVE